ncbi:hypothetical protein AVEN_233483-1 [Araneus ventricosus]|uniref:Uncharacterized protein n=1 Tax=Araneus ventricosus TaxID=182803 RepID=A0A4Y2TKZ9_ARAVE|nr:hypothetical protein AVEN_233483-1 [Araneus ventricosus]
MRLKSNGKFDREKFANLKAEKEAGKSDENVKEHLEEKKRETAKLTSHANSMKNENAVITKLISDYLQKLSDRFEDLLDQSVILYMVDKEIFLVRDYIDRLNNVRLRRETKVEEEEVVRTEELKELETILNVQRNEEAFLKMLLDHYLKRVKEGLLINSVFLHKSQEQAFEYLQL